ncbi:stage II sporulation protein M [Paenibacillus sp. J2TS4]|uniref:stage II sporulation protein M n=1 Tax=Paenibacillus sp. J2TS4 TaxID=2807194 RepID=UPI001B05B846|nr:stage II sporulation protein M [Paenibacillus sp. J2TS4]GIP36304.1 hypothetical protein J2TS4_55140 [Paenibacillus sp. J2TS4]
MSFGALLKHFKEMKHYFIAAVLVFAVGVWMGFYSPDTFGTFINGQIDRLSGTAGGLMQQDNSQRLLFFFILMNNTFLSIAIMYLGAFFAIVPLYFLVSNGLLLGYLALGNSGVQDWLMFFKSIAPHGIIEIPAIIIASAYGIRFGFLMAEGTLTFISAKRRAVMRNKLFAFLQHTIPLLAVISGMLLLAAIVESTFTLWLISK